MRPSPPRPDPHFPTHRPSLLTRSTLLLITAKLSPYSPHYKFIMFSHSLCCVCLHTSQKLYLVCGCGSGNKPGKGWSITPANVSSVAMWLMVTARGPGKWLAGLLAYTHLSLPLFLHKADFTRTMKEVSPNFCPYIYSISDFYCIVYCLPCYRTKYCAHPNPRVQV